MSHDFKQMATEQAKSKKNITFDRAKQALEEMKQQRLVINFNSLATYANISKAWLYRDPIIRTEVENLRNEMPIKQRSANLTKLIAKRDKEIAKLRREVDELEQINQKLRRQLEVVYGKLHEKQHHE